MPVMVDIVCSKCELVVVDQWSTQVGTSHRANGNRGCGGIMEHSWSLTPAPAPGTHASEAVVLYKSDKEGGKIQYPGRGDTPVPARLRARGYEKITLNVRDLAAFERKHNVMNERRHYNSNGRGLGD